MRHGTAIRTWFPGNRLDSGAAAAPLSEDRHASASACHARGVALACSMLLAELFSLAGADEALLLPAGTQNQLALGEFFDRDHLRRIDIAQLDQALRECI
jgi:hypothetical protein